MARGSGALVAGVRRVACNEKLLKLRQEQRMRNKTGLRMLFTMQCHTIPIFNRGRDLQSVVLGGDRFHREK